MTLMSPSEHSQLHIHVGGSTHEPRSELHGSAKGMFVTGKPLTCILQGLAAWYRQQLASSASQPTPEKAPQVRAPAEALASPLDRMGLRSPVQGSRAARRLSLASEASSLASTMRKVDSAGLWCWQVHVAGLMLADAREAASCAHPWTCQILQAGHVHQDIWCQNGCHAASMIWEFHMHDGQIHGVSCAAALAES